MTLKGGTRGASFFLADLLNNARTVDLSIKIGRMTHVEDRCISGVNHASTARGRRAPALTNFGGSLFMPTPFNAEGPRSTR